MIKALTPIIAILAITFLLTYAITQHIDGLLLAGAATIIAGLGGYFAPHKK